MRGLTDKQKLFCKFYTDTLNETTYQNGTQSAIAAGYGVSGAHVTASRTLKDAKVIEYMAFLKLSMEEIFSQYAHESAGVLLEIQGDKKQPAASRVRAATEIMSRAGFVAPTKVIGQVQHNHTGSVTNTDKREVHIIQELVNSDEHVADALLNALKDRGNKLTVIPTVQAEEENT